jgi:hypothetical protein
MSDKRNETAPMPQTFISKDKIVTVNRCGPIHAPRRPLHFAAEEPRQGDFGTDARSRPGHENRHGRWLPLP